MNKKKMFMIIVLICFIGIIGILLFNVHNKSIEKINKESNNTDTSNGSNSLNVNEVVVTDNEKIRKSKEKANADMNNIIEITDNFFIQQTNDIYLNLEDYIGKTVKIEGFVYSFYDTNGDICYAVVRNSPGCCGNDGLAGLEIRHYDNYPDTKTWVEVIGVIGTDFVKGSTVPVIHISTITEKEEGVTFVSN